MTSETDLRSIIQHPISNSWIESFSKRKDLRRIKSALKKVIKTEKHPPEEEVWQALAACELVACLKGRPNNELDKKLLSWGKKKGLDDEELQKQSQEVLQRLPLKFRFQNQEAALLAELHSRLTDGHSFESETTDIFEVATPKAEVLPFMREHENQDTAIALKEEDTGPEDEEQKAVQIAEDVATKECVDDDNHEQHASIQAHLPKTAPIATNTLQRIKDSESDPEGTLPDAFLIIRNDASKALRKITFATPQASLEALATFIGRFENDQSIVTLDLSHEYQKEHFEKLAECLSEKWKSVILHIKDPSRKRDSQWMSNSLQPLKEAINVILELENKELPLDWMANFTEVRSLYLKSDGASLKFIPYLSKLTSLHVSKEVTDLTSIAKVPVLKSLSLEGISLDSGIISCIPAHLRALELTGCKVKGALQLEHLVDLQSLIIADIGTVRSLSFLYDLPGLSRLSVYGIPGITDLSPLISAESLRYLSLRFLNNLSDISALVNLSGLDTFVASGLTRIRSLPEFTRMTSLKRIHLEMFSNLRDYKPLLSAPVLQELVLGFTHESLRVRDFEFLRQHPTLERFELRNTFREHLAYEVNQLLGMPCPDEQSW